MILDDCYIGYLNLDHRQDRLQHIQSELARVGLSGERTRGNNDNIDFFSSVLTDIIKV